MTGKRMNSGIQKKYLKYTVALLILALFLSGSGVWMYVRDSMTEAVIEKYVFMTERMGIALDNLYQKSDEVTAECILNDNVQKSLIAKPLEETEKSTLSKYFAYIDLEDVADYCYIDNKGNVYARPYSRVSYRDFIGSGFSRLLDGEYAKTKWFWTEDTLFGTGEEALFIGRYIRNMEYAHKPGILFLKMDDNFLTDYIGENEENGREIITGILDGAGNICSLKMPDEYSMKEELQEEIRELVKNDQEGILERGRKISGGVLSAYRQKNGGMLVFTFVPDSVLNSGLNRIFLVLSGIYLLIVAVAGVISVYFSRRFTKPIQDISEAMTDFDGQSFERTIELHTNTELDQIGSSYNKMLENIERLLKEIKAQERELRTSELNMLISQINPHFLYNTLDTIYMLARISREETTMRMIQALSRYLRLSLSKGNDIVTVEDELENVKSYMEIQQIRNESLFSYEVECKVDPVDTWVLKLILQPLVENAIKYGFCDIFEGGYIRIEVRKEEAHLVFDVYNNGTPIDSEKCRQLNELEKVQLSKMKDIFPDKKHGYGVVNVITRLRLKYGEDVSFYYEAYEDGTRCVIKIPKEEVRDDEETEKERN